MRPNRRFLAIGALAAASAPALAQYSITWYEMTSAGGGHSEGGIYSISGTIGQSDAGTLSRFPFRLEGGFWGLTGVMPGCSPADLAEPYGVLDFSDVIAFLVAFKEMDPAADLGFPIGIWDFSDILQFLVEFSEGC